MTNRRLVEFRNHGKCWATKNTTVICPSTMTKWQRTSVSPAPPSKDLPISALFPCSTRSSATRGLSAAASVPTTNHGGRRRGRVVVEHVAESGGPDQCRKRDGTPVLTGSASLSRLRRDRTGWAQRNCDPRSAGSSATLRSDSWARVTLSMRKWHSIRTWAPYAFSLAEKLQKITEQHPTMAATIPGAEP